jgi:hypothetical protein
MVGASRSSTKVLLGGALVKKGSSTSTLCSKIPPSESLCPQIVIEKSIRRENNQNITQETKFVSHNTYEKGKSTQYYPFV